jgi:diguanylate cyclase (GGDEF)-like protein
LVGKPLSVYYQGTDDEHVVESYKVRFREHSVADHLERTMQLWDGRTITMRISNTFIHTPDGEMLLGIFHDLTTQKALENELRANATTDALTGLHTRRSLMEEFLKEFARAQRYGSPLSVLMLDLDHFKNVNDSYGHMVGDNVLSKAGQIIRESLRFTDIAGRYGGEEFCIFMPETDLEGAHIFAERLRQQLSSETYKSDDGHIFSVTCSIGVAQLSDAYEDPIEYLSAVDRALYQAKGEGRDRVCVG